MTLAAVGGQREGVLAWTAKEEEGKGREVEDGLGMGLIMILGEAGDEGMEDGDVDWTHLGGGGICIGPGFEEGLEAEDIQSAHIKGYNLKVTLTDFWWIPICEVQALSNL